MKNERKHFVELLEEICNPGTGGVPPLNIGNLSESSVEDVELLKYFINPVFGVEVEFELQKLPPL